MPDPAQSTPAFFKVGKAPFFVTVFSALAVNFTTTNRFSSGTQIRFFFRFGSNVRVTTFVTCWPMPPFFLARPRRCTMDPLTGLAWVISQILLIEYLLKRGRELGGGKGSGQGICLLLTANSTGARIVQRRDVRIDHDPDQLTEASLRLPAQLCLRFRRVANEEIHLCRPFVALVVFHVLLPV